MARQVKRWIAMLMVLAMCLSLLPASTLAATLSDGSTTNTLGTGAYSITLKNDCDAAVKYSVTLNGTTTEVTLNGGENLTLRGDAGQDYSVTWKEGTSEDYSYTTPDQVTKSGTFGQAASGYDGFDGYDGKQYSTSEVTNTPLVDNTRNTGITSEVNFYYVIDSVIPFYTDKTDWYTTGFSYWNEKTEERFGGLTTSRENARKQALSSLELSDSDTDRYTNITNDGQDKGYMWVYWKATPYISFTSTAEQTQDITGSFKVAALNVDGMPEQVSITVFNGEVSSISLNQDGPQETGSEKIGQYIANSDIDILGLSENFNFYQAIQDNATGYATGTQRLQEGLPTSIGVWNALQIEFPFDTDGLNLMYKTSKGITVSGETMTAWTDHYSPTKFYGLGSIGIDVPQENGADGMIDKGYRFYQVKVDTGVVVDVYILHMDAYDDPLDNDARSKQLRQLAAAINQNTNGNPIIVMGDTNCRYTRDTLKTDLVEACDLTDAWIKLERNNIYPNMGDEALMVTNPDLGYQKGEVVDKVFYKNAEGSNLTIEAVDYDVDADGYVYEGTTNMLGDHPPVIVKFKYTLQSNNQEHEHKWSSEWSSDEGHHWHECTVEGCTIPMNSDKGNFAEHTFNETVDKQPTCTEPGSQTLTCSECGYTKTESIPATGHSWGEGVVTKPATSTEKGEMTYTCTVCEATYTEEIPKHEHVWSDAWSHNANGHWKTCTATGCDIKDNTDISQNSTYAAHTWDDGEVTTPATTTTPGIKTYTCDVCGATKTETIPVITPYTVTVEFNKDDYNVGENGTATISVSSPSATAAFVSLGFEFIVPDGLDITGFTPKISGSIESNLDKNKWGFTLSGGDPIDVNDSIEVLTVNFTVTDGFENDTAQATLDLTARVGDPTLSDGKYDDPDNEVEATTVPDTATLHKMCTVTFQGSEYVTLNSGATSVSVPVGTTFGELTAAGKVPGYAVEDNYEFTGWFMSDNVKVEANTAFTTSTTLTAKAAAKNFNFSYTITPSAGAEVTDLTGVTNNNQATYGEAISFKVDPADNYVVTSVAYSVAGGSVTSTPVPYENGVYTIPGTNIVGDVKVEIAVSRYVTVTFQPGTGSQSFTSQTAYAIAGSGVLYTDPIFDDAHKLNTLPTPSPATGYRLDTADGTIQWTNSANKYTATAILEGNGLTYSENTIFTPATVKTYQVTFNAGEHGAFADGSKSKTVTVDTGTVLSTQIPVVNANTGYTFNNTWTSNKSFDIDDAITADVTFTARYTDATYTLTLPNIDGVTFTVTDGATLNGNGTYTVTHGTDVTIGVDVDETKADVDSVTYAITNGKSEEVMDFSNGITIQGSDIVGSIILTVDSTAVYAITVTVSGGHGTVDGGTTSTQYFNKGTTEEQLEDAFKIEAETGYTFIYPEYQEVTGPANYTVYFTPVAYSVTYPDGAAGTLPDSASHGLALTFKPTLAANQFLLDVTYQVGGGQPQTPTANGDGSYTIPGNQVTGDITISYRLVTGEWEIVLNADYVTAPADKNVAILKTAKVENGGYSLGQYGNMFYSKLYKGYVCFVADTETLATLPELLGTTDTPAIELDYSGDINGNNEVTPFDAAAINSALNMDGEFDQKTLLEFDVTGDKKVSTNDIMKILNTYVNS